MSKKLAIVVVIILLVIAGVLGYRLYNNKQAEKRGEEKFQQAISEIVAENPELNNPCLGTHVTRWNSYVELSKKSIEEIKQIAKEAPGDC